MTATRTKPPVAIAADEDARGPFTIGLTSATNVGLSPRWVQYSGVSPHARAAAEVLADMATMHTSGDQAPTLDRERVAYHVGIGRADKLAPVLDELVAIGFLTIYSGGVDPITGKRRQRRDSQGRPIPDRFSITLHPPVGYVGPSNLTEADIEFACDRDAAYEAAKDAGKRVRAGNITIHRTSVGRHIKPQVSPDTQIRGQAAGADPGIGGQLTFPQVSPDTQIRGHLQIDRSSISEREIEGSIEPVPGGAAQPPATGKDEALLAQVRRLVARIPWAPWAKRQEVQYQFNLMDARLVAEPIYAAIAANRLTIEQAELIGPAALNEVTRSAKPADYVASAFGVHLDKWLDRITPVLPEEDLLPLPGVPAAAPSGPGRDKRQGPRPATTEPDGGEEPKRVLPACATCRAEENEHYPSARTVTGADGREVPCPDCDALGLCRPIGKSAR
ncbi:hypothetical protein GCM10010174_81030 [Kutzneria viridogrisea]|uniref:hypothetical protein n=1 Tax=Kutzneria viridogrisea TaxID=47990 RepID=UPI0031F95030